MGYRGEAKTTEEHIAYIYELLRRLRPIATDASHNLLSPTHLDTDFATSKTQGDVPIWIEEISRWVPGALSAQPGVIALCDIAVDQVVSTSTAWKLIVTGTPPAGWEDAGFDDSSYDNAVVPTGSATWFDFGSETWIWESVGTPDQESGEEVSFRTEFDITALPASAILQFAVDNGGEVYLNGTLIASRGVGDRGGPSSTNEYSAIAISSVSPGLFVVGANCLSIIAWNATQASQGPAGVYAVLTLDSAELAGESELAARCDHDHNHDDLVGGDHGGGSGGGTPPLDVVPTSPHASDDEFGGSSLDAKWTSAGLNVTTAVANGWVSIEPATTGTANTGTRGGFGIYQVSPSGDFTISARVANGEGDAGVDDGRGGIFVAETTGSVGHVLGYQSSVPRVANAIGFTYNEGSEWGGFDGFDSAATARSSADSGLWYRIRWDSASSTLFFYWSTDGVFWRLLTSRAAQDQPDRIGIALYGNMQDIKADHRLGADWFRVTEP